MPGPINRASIKPSADSRLRLSRVPRYNNQCKRIAGNYDDGASHHNAIKVTFVGCSSSTPLSRCHSRVMRDVSARQWQGCLTLEGQPSLPLSTLSVQYIARSPSIFGILVAGRVLYERGDHDGVPIKACDANSLVALREHIAWLLFMPHPKHSPGVRATRLHAISTFLFPVGSGPTRFDSPLASCVWTPSLLSTSLEERAVILPDKSSDVISHRQQILRRLNVSQEGGHSTISLCLTIYILHPGFSRVKSSSLRSSIKCTLWIYLSIATKATCRNI